MAQFLDLYRKCFITSGKNPSHGRLSTVGLRAFNPLSLFLAGEQGAWYDPSDLTTLFQDSAGTTPVTAVEQPVGLMLDKSRGLALGAELVTNGGPFTNTTGWVSGTTLTSTAAVSNSEIVITTTAAFGRQITTFSTVTGSTYKMTAVIRTVSGGNVYVNINRSGSQGDDLGTAQISSTINTQVQIIFTATSTTTNLAISGNANNTVCVLVSASVKQIAGNHAFQATAGNRPMLSARVNLLTKTEDFSDSVWTKTGSTISNSTIDTPEGTQLTAKLIGNNTSTACYTTQFYTSIGTAYTCTIYAKAANTPRVSIWEGNSSAFYSTFDLISGTVVANSGATGSISSIGNGWFKCSMTSTQTSGTRGFYTVLIGALGTGPFATGFSGDGVSGIYIWHPDLRPTNSGALLPPYQRVNTASDYDTVGFPLYLKANGTSSAMSTNSIDFTSTDKMTVVTGVRKLAEAINFIMETSTSVGTAGSGAFLIHTAGGGIYRIAVSSTNSNPFFASDDVTSFVAPLSNVISASLDVSKSTVPQVIIDKVNGASPTHTYSGTAIVGTFGNYPLYLFARGGAQYYLNGQFYGVIIRGAQSDTASVTQTENYMATKTGITF